jgi:hypothetical protein
VDRRWHRLEQTNFEDLGVLSEIDHLLFWLLTHKKTTQNGWYISSSKEKKQNNTHTLDDTILLKEKPYLNPGLPSDVGHWLGEDGQIGLFEIKSWHHITGYKIFDDNHTKNNNTSDHKIKNWVSHLRSGIGHLEAIQHLMPYTFGYPGLPVDIFKRDNPLCTEKLSSHIFLQAVKDAQGLLPVSQATVRLLVAID